LLGQGWFVHFSPQTGDKALVLEGAILSERVFGARSKAEADRIRARVLKGDVPACCTIVAVPFDAPKDQIARLAEQQGPNFAAALQRSKIKYTVAGGGDLPKAVWEAILHLTGGVAA
jgi:hypothetical protein